MPKINFLVNNDIWEILDKHVAKANHIDAAIAYLGSNSSQLLPLKKNDRLVTDMSIGTIKAGATNPFEIEKMIKKGVKVFTRNNLHAKLIIMDKYIIVGSANISVNSRDYLDEVAIISNDKISVSRAKEFINRICIEPVLPNYLEECKKHYKKPHITRKKSSSGRKISRITHAKLRIVNLVDFYNFPESENNKYSQSESRALKLINEEKSKLGTFHWSNEPPMLKDLEIGDMFIRSITHVDKTTTILPPSKLILVDIYIRNRLTNKKRYLFHLECPKSGETIPWVKFRKSLTHILGKKFIKPRNIVIRSTQEADELLRLWTPSGRVAKK